MWIISGSPDDECGMSDNGLPIVPSTASNSRVSSDLIQCTDTSTYLQGSVADYSTRAQGSGRGAEVSPRLRFDDSIARAVSVVVVMVSGRCRCRRHLGKYGGSNEMTIINRLKKGALSRSTSWWLVILNITEVF